MSIENPFDDLKKSEGLDVFIDTAPAAENLGDHKIEVKSENREKGREIMETSSEERAEFLEAGLVARLREFIKSKVEYHTQTPEGYEKLFELVPLNMPFEAWRGETQFTGRPLTGADRLVHMAIPLAVATAYACAALEMTSDAPSMKLAVVAGISKVASWVLPFAKEFVINGDFVAKYGNTLKEGLTTGHDELIKAFSQIAGSLDFSNINSLTYKERLISDLEAISQNG